MKGRAYLSTAFFVGKTGLSSIFVEQRGPHDA